MSRRRSDKGFTLLEVILSISLTALILVIVGGAMWLSFRSIERGEKRMEYTERIRASLSILDSQIQSGIPMIEDGQDGRKYHFKGSSDSMQFISSYSIWSGQKGYVDVSYKIEANSYGKRTLTAAESIVGTEKARKARILDNLDALSFEYFYKGPTDEKGKWVQSWTDDTAIPEIVKVHILYGDRDLSLVIPMKARANISGTL